MARYKKRPTYNDSTPGLFDDLEISMSPKGADAFPIHPAIEKEAMRMRRKEEELRSRNAARQPLFENGDDISPLEASPYIDRLNFISFGSGSSGNCTYIGDGTSGLLIDAGVATDTVVEELRRNGIDMRSIKGILLTHDHSDHVRFIYSLVRTYRHMRVYCTPRTLNGMLRRHSIPNRIRDYHQPIYKEHPFKLGTFTVLPFEVMHDGTDNVGFFLTHGQHNMVVATDLGCISDRVDFYMRQANYLMIEANYDASMLAAGNYPEYLKARIRSNNGHLDNAETARYIASIYSPRLRNIFLCHLSKDNNTPELALLEVEAALHRIGINCVGDCSETPYSRMAPVQLKALPRFESTGLIALRLGPSGSNDQPNPSMA